MYGHWLLLISRPHMWPLPNDLLIKVKKEDQHFLGGVKAQQTNDENERNRLATRSRCTGARLLGKLAGFIAKPVPGFDYSKDQLTPLQMFCSKILLANMTKSAFQCTAIGQLFIKLLLDINSTHGGQIAFVLIRSNCKVTRMY